MPLKEHPDYKEEVERLEFTKNAIQKTIEVIDKNKQIYKEGIREAFENLDYLDSSQSYITILTNSKFIDLDDKTRERLVQVRKKPYFGRIDFRTKGSQEAEKIYLGKAPLYRNNDNKPLIVDWRAPIANVYYEGRLGEMSYETPTGPVEGDLELKRQYTIEDGELENILDIDITTTDVFLQASLEAGADSRLKDIASTIQAEQNRIIRADIEKPLIVQGVAGSGKTTIALHRIAYLIYTYEENFLPENFMIIAPNNLFLNYISEVLPELGVERVKQTTFVDLIYELIGKKFKMISPDEKLVLFINEGTGKEDEHNQAMLKWASSFKGSMVFKAILDRYINDLEQSFAPQEDFSLGEYPILNAGEIKNIFISEYDFLPLYKRIKEVKKVLSHKLKSSKEKIFEEIKKDYEERIDTARARYGDSEQRRTKVVELMDAREEKLESLQKAARTLVNKYMAKFPKQDLFFYYKELLTKEKNLSKYAEGSLEQEKIIFICDYSAKLLNKKQFEIEDSAGLLYLQARIFGFKEKLETNTVVIDEAQDFSNFQLYALKDVLNTSRFTILGDLSQGVYSYRGTGDWQDVIHDVFEEDCNYRTLRQSYRTTIEIMNLANEVIKKWNDTESILARPVIRHGEKPQLVKCNSLGEIIQFVKTQVKELNQQGLKSIALICKTLDECKKVKKHLSKDKSLEAEMLTGKEDNYQGGVVILPSYLAKGLEFDAVFITGAESEYTQNELDIKLLYVAMTRAHHKLYILQVGNTIPILSDISSEYYREGTR